MSYRLCVTLSASLMFAFVSAVPAASPTQHEPGITPTEAVETGADLEATPAPVVSEQTGIASWYGMHWQGRKTASGTRFDVRKLTAAHRTLPLNTVVRVTNLLNGATVEVLVNDRGPYVGERVIDLSEAAAKRLNMVHKGIVPVRIEIVEPA